jgi:excisionase family DNA binding protein
MVQRFTPDSANGDHLISMHWGAGPSRTPEKRPDIAREAPEDRQRSDRDQAVICTNAPLVLFGPQHPWHSVYRDGEMVERGELTLEEVARRLAVSKMTVLRLIGHGVIQAPQVRKGAPWAISAAELAGLHTRTALARRPQPENPDQRSFIFQCRGKVRYSGANGTGIGKPGGSRSRR